jgi:GH25 family lysozyme M1 (1,4-beta-N-acetylmuramidase)
MTGNPFDPKSASVYGQFVQAAYTMFDAEPTNLTPLPSADFPDGYRMMAWIQMQDFVLGNTAPLFYGFIAQSQTAPGQLVLAIRGTSDAIEWWDDFNALELTAFKNPAWGQVGSGFARIYDTLEVVERPSESVPEAAASRTMRPVGGFAQQVSALISRHVAPRPPARARASARAATSLPNATVEVTGHSLGAALATLYAMENAKTEQIANPMLCTFASPLVGDATFATTFNALELTSWRIDNIKDLVTKVPPTILGFRHVDQQEQVNSSGKVVPNPVCWHSLATYLSLIDPTKQPDATCLLPSTEALPLPPIAAPGLIRSSALGAVQMTRPFVIDINHANNVQDTPNPLGGFAKAKAAGIAFLIHKASEGLTFSDPRYQARRVAWMNGIPVPVTDVTGEVLQITPRFAAYHFFHGENPAAEAEFFLKTSQLQHGDDAVVDWEAVPGSGFIPSADAVDQFCSIVEGELGFPIIVYSGNAAKQQIKGKDPRFAKRRLWLAEYSSAWSVQQSWSSPWLWQNNGGQSGGMNSIAGIDGNCDNSTIVSPMTIKQLAADWGGGAQALTAQVRRVAIIRSMRASPRPTGFTGTPRKIARYGWKPDLPDQRDHSYAPPPEALRSASDKVDLRPLCPQIYDQGQIGSCTANAIAAALEFDMMRQGLSSYTPSRLFIYYNERKIESTVPLDAGAQIRDGIKSVASQGDCPESEWTYDATPADPNSNLFPPNSKAVTPPSPQCYADAIIHKALTYESVDQNLADMKSCLTSGYPFVFGFTVYPSFESDEVARSGNVPMPRSDETTVGGHAVLAVGYDDGRNSFIVRNSWGPQWGLAGYCYMPYAYLLDDNLANDFWTVRLVN